MASTDDKAVSADVASAAHSTDEAVVDIPKGWKYKAPKWAKKYYYASPEVQLLLVSITCFLCPGMFINTRPLDRIASNRFFFVDVC